MSKLALSVFIIAKDEADRISLAIKSVIDWVDEVIVIDCGSIDGTPQLASSLGAKVMFNEWKGYGPQKVFGEGQCKNDWILNIDADEELSPELAQEIQGIMHAGPKHWGYRMKIYAIYPHQKKLPCIPAGTTQIRLYHRQHAGFKDSTVHDSVVMKDGSKEQMLKHVAIHRSFRSYSHALTKINSYSDLQAQDMFTRGKNPSFIKIIYTPFFAFIKCYFLKRYMFYGLDGFLHAWVYAFGRTIRVAKARELFQQKNK